MMYGKLFYKIYFDVLGVVFYWKNMMFITEEKRIFAQNPDNMIKIANEIAHWKEQRKDILHNKELKLTQFIEKIYNVINLKNKKINTGGEDMKAIVVDKNSADGLDYSIQQRIFEENGIEFILEDCQTEDEIIEKCKDADALLVIYRQITPRIMDALKNCKVILRYGIGYDVIDVKAATERGIKVCNSPRHCLDEVATHTIAMILAMERKLVFYHNLVKQGKWLANEGFKPHRLSTQTLGFVGFGNIARRAAEFAKGFGFRMLAYDPFLPEEVVKAAGAEKVELNQLLEESDVISLHTPLMDSTFHLINKDTIAKMKDGVMIVNTSRGPIIAIDDLMEAVKFGKIKAAALDVVEGEPIVVPDHPLFETGHIICSPHAAYNSVEAEAQMMEVLATTAVDILNGKNPANIVNKKELGL